jgi:sterol desaturase/sphingolipid hydroxylase (fatty acid hydroxylase superfamily)
MPHAMRFAYPYLLLLMLIEAVLIWQHRPSHFSWQESLTSLGVAIGGQITKAPFQIIPMMAYAYIWEHRLLTIPLDQGWSILLLFLGLEFFYYWHHRAAHAVRWLWATHVVHHSAQHLNLSAAYRLGWTGWLSGNFLFFMPLCWFGFHPIAITTGLGFNLTYQFWLHTELIPKLGLLEWILNTPSHHRVHHASNLACLDRNFGGVLIIFDRWFGTFTAEPVGDRLVYGLTHPLRSYNPVVIALHEWQRLFRDLTTADTWRERGQTILGRPI